MRGEETMLKLYQVEWCPACHRVRQVMTELGISYELVNVSADRDERDDVVAVSGQDTVPVLVEDDTVLVHAEAIIDHLRATRAARPDTAEHVSRGRFRIVVKLALPPSEALARLREALADQDIAVVSETPGDAIAPDRFPPGYTLVHAASPSAATLAVRADPTAPAAVTVPIAVYAGDGATEIAVTKPMATVWLYGSTETTRVAQALTERVMKAVRDL
jgi:glutaredoxin/uncharacterized protein (DUF302 family)